MEKKLITALLFIVTVGLAGYAIRNPSWGPALLAAVGAALFLIINPRALLLALVCAGASGLRMPGMGETLSLEAALFALAIGYSILHVSLVKEKLPRDLCDRGLLIFGLTILMIMCVRGFGLRLAGSSSYGGKDYILIFLALLAYKAVQSIKLNAKQTRTMVYCFVAATALPATAQLVAFASPGMARGIEHFINANTGYLLEMGANAGGIQVSEAARWQGAGALATALWFVAMARFSLSPGKHKILYPAFGLVILITALGGFRSATVNRLVVCAVSLIAVSRNRWRTAVTLVGLAVMGYLVLMMIGSQLPYALQRSVSFIPGIDWGTKVLSDGASSVDWRLEVWKYCLANVPQHLFVGRGLLLENVVQHAWFNWEYYVTPEFYYAAHGYHSGPLSLLLDTGITGLIGFFIFQLGMVLNTVRYFRNSVGSSNLFLRGYMLALVISTSYGMFAYYFIFGDIKATFPILIINAIIIRITGETLMKEKADAALAAEVSGQPSEDGGQRSEIRSQRSDQLTTNNSTSVNRWARSGAARR